jgi:DNA-binding NarL/FixJ family response regulator
MAEVWPYSLDQIYEAPHGAILLVELFLPGNHCGISMVQEVWQARRDILPILWSVEPAPLYLWAALDAKLPGFLDKAMGIAELQSWLYHAATMRAAWPGELIAQAQHWECDVAVRLRTLQSTHWTLWHSIVAGHGPVEVARQRGWSRRTVERRLTELYTSLGTQQRSELSRLALEWKLINMREGCIGWSDVVKQRFQAVEAELELEMT